MRRRLKKIEHRLKSFRELICQTFENSQSSQTGTLKLHASDQIRNAIRNVGNMICVYVGLWESSHKKTKKDAIFLLEKLEP